MPEDGTRVLSFFQPEVVMNREQVISAALSGYANFASVINWEFSPDDSNTSNFFMLAEEDLRSVAFADETIFTLAKLLLSAELWLREFVSTKRHNGILYSAPFVSQVIQQMQGRTSRAGQISDPEILVLIRRNDVLRSFLTFEVFPVGVDRKEIAITLTSILDAAIQPFMESSGWQLGVLPDIVPQLMHPNADAEFLKRFGSVLE